MRDALLPTSVALLQTPPELLELELIIALRVHVSLGGYGKLAEARRSQHDLGCCSCRPGCWGCNTTTLCLWSALSCKSG